MPVEANAPQQMSVLQFLLSSGGLPLAACGIVFSVWGIINVICPRNPGWIFTQAVLSLQPSIFAMAGIYAACLRFIEMSSSPTSPKPAELAAVTGAAMSYGFLGIASTLVPVMLGLVAFRRHCRLRAELPTLNE